MFPHVLEAEGGHGVVLPGVPHAASQPPLLGLIVVLEDVVIAAALGTVEIVASWETIP